MGEFKKGQEVYLANGSKAEYVQPLDSGKHLVMPLYVKEEYYGELEGYGTDVYTSGHDVVDVVFAEQPKNLLADIVTEVDEKKAEMVRLSKDLNLLKSEHTEKLLEVDRLFQDLSRYDHLANLKGLLDGKATHVAMKDRNSKYEVVSFKQFIEGKTDKGLMVLRFGSGWRDGFKGQATSSMYNDYLYPAVPCFSEEEAEAELINIVVDDLKEAWCRFNDASNSCELSYPPKRIRDISVEIRHGFELNNLKAALKTALTHIRDDHAVAVEIRQWIDQYSAAEGEREKEQKRRQFEKLKAEVEA